MSGTRQLKRYQLQWRPTFPYPVSNIPGPAFANPVVGAVRTAFGVSNTAPGVRMYVIGEEDFFRGENYENLSAENTAAQEGQVGLDPNATSLSDLISLGSNTTLILPFNTTVALAQEYTPRYKNKVIEYETLGGNSITTFGEGIKKIGLKIRIIRAGRNYEIYQKGVEAMAYLSGNQSRYPGSLYLIGYDQFSDGTETVAGRYKVIVNTLDYAYRSSENTSINATLEMTVLHDYGHRKSAKNRKWGAL